MFTVIKYYGNIFFGPENMGIGTKIDFLSQSLRNIRDIDDLAHNAQATILFLLIHNFNQGVKVSLS